MGVMDNPFERFDLDPRDGITVITERLKARAEDARDEAEREQIRRAWEELTLHPARRLRAALFAHPETRPMLGAPPPLTRMRAVATEFGLRDLAARPSVAAALDLPPGAPEDAPPPLPDDPLLRTA